MFWSDITTDTIHRAKLDGTSEEVLVSTCISSVGKLAITKHNETEILMK